MSMSSRLAAKAQPSVTIDAWDGTSTFDLVAYAETVQTVAEIAHACLAFSCVLEDSEPSWPYNSRPVGA